MNWKKLNRISLILFAVALVALVAFGATRDPFGWQDAETAATDTALLASEPTKYEEVSNFDDLEELYATNSSYVFGFVTMPDQGWEPVGRFSRPKKDARQCRGDIPDERVCVYARVPKDDGKTYYYGLRPNGEHVRYERYKLR